MVKDNITMAVGRVGMNRDAHPTTLENTEYTFALNTNYQDSNGTGVFLLQNENSNVLFTRFKSGFKVVGKKYNIVTNKTYFFLHNKETGVSEIGYIDNSVEYKDREDLYVKCDCDYKKEETEPLEKIEQVPYGKYVTLVNDECNKCLNFSIDYPIKEGNIVIKNEKCGETIYWTDGVNGFRYLEVFEYNKPNFVKGSGKDISDFNKYSYLDSTSCGNEDLVSSVCVDCDKLEVFKKYEAPLIEAKDIVFGGNLKLGVYEYMIAYCDYMGNELSNYHSKTNPISVFDNNNLIFNQTELDYLSPYAIQLNVDNLDRDFAYYKVVVIQRTDVSGALSVFELGVFPRTQNTILHTTSEHLKRTSLNKIFNILTHYEKVEGITQSGNHLFAYGLTPRRNINLQPIANLLGGFVQWQTVTANEDIYENGVQSSNYRGYMRGEVYPLAIRFGGDGIETNPFILIPRPATDYENEEVNSEEIKSVKQLSLSCVGNERSKRWEFFDTSQILGICPADSESREVKEITRSVETYCDNKDVYTFGAGVFTLDISDEEYYDSLEYLVNNNRDGLPTDFQNMWNQMEIDTADIHCEPIFYGTCENTSEPTETLYYISDIVNEQIEFVALPYNEYKHLKVKDSCDVFIKDEHYKKDNIELLNKREVEDLPVNNTIDNASPIELGNKTSNISGDIFFSSCFRALSDAEVSSFPNLGSGHKHIAWSSELKEFVKSNFIEDTTYVSKDYGVVIDYRDSPQVEYRTYHWFFYPEINKNAFWYEIEFGDKEELLLEVVRRGGVNYRPDLNETDIVRVNVFDRKKSEAVYSNKNVDVSKGLFITLRKSDFSKGKAYVSVDSPVSFLHRPTLRRRNFWGQNFYVWHNGVVTSTPLGCFNVVLREKEYKEVRVKYDSIKVGKKEKYETTCTYSVPTLNNCESTNYQFGKFSYWQSIINYPDNNELYNSQKLKIKSSDIPERIRTEFEDYYVQNTDDNGTYVLKNEADFRCKPIRHYKFPTSEKVPFLVEDYNVDFKSSLIYPIGIKLDNDIVNSFLDLAVKQELLTQQERDSIKYYEILRGDRTTEKSIIAKGLLFDMYKYRESNKDVLYPNYPYNALGEDVLHKVSREDSAPKIKHPYKSESNIHFTFHSPDVHFRKPILGREMYVEGYMFGKSKGKFTDVLDHPTWVVLTDRAFEYARTLAWAEYLVTEMSGLTSGGIGSWLNPANLVKNLAKYVLSIIFPKIDFFYEVARLRTQWIQYYIDNGSLEQFSSYYSSVGYYNYFKKNENIGNTLRGLALSKYMKSGRFIFVEEAENKEIRVNNVDRESSVILSLGGSTKYRLDYPEFYKNYDNSDTSEYASSRTTKGISRVCDSDLEVVKNIASPYVSIKNYLPAQYGKVNNINWIDTGKRIELNKGDKKCEAIFGGDVFITRFALKRKIPIFLSNAIGLAPYSPFNYTIHRNIGYPSFYLNYLAVGNERADRGGTISPRVQFDFVFDCQKDGGLYYTSRSKFYLFYYGIPYFLVESEINCNYRYSKKELHESFYPYEQDYVNWTQEKNVSIRRDNEFYYNNNYSRPPIPTSKFLLPDTFEAEKYDCLEQMPNGVIYSEIDNSEKDLTDSWLVFKPFNKYEFPSSYGKLIDLKGIESSQVLGRFEHQAVLFNAIDVLRERVSPENAELGTGGIFSQRPREWKRTDLGYAGTQHKDMVSCEFGHFWVDVMRGQVFSIDQNGGSLEEITQGMKMWFKEHLPFKFLKNTGNNITTKELDNNFKGLGIAMGWDSVHNRVFLTKKDYVAKEAMNLYISNGKILDKNERDYHIQVKNDLGIGLHREEGNKLYFKDKSVVILTEVDLQDKSKFEDVSFTIAYSPILKRWLSYYSFAPNYYVSYNDYFQTGINYAYDEKELGLWSHLVTNRSYQVFYGKKRDWTIELPIKQDFINKIVNSVTYWLDSRRYHNRNDFAENRKKGFNKAVLYNHSSNTGVLNLVTSELNNRYQKLQYPKYNRDSVDVLATQTDKRWTFNFLNNFVFDENNNVPIWLRDKNDINQIINSRALGYRKPNVGRMKGDWFLLRLTQDVETNYKFIFKHLFSNEKLYR